MVVLVRGIECLVPFSIFCDACVCFLYRNRATGVIGLPAIPCFCIAGLNAHWGLLSLVSSFCLYVVDA